jgi:hypothetical protein
MGTKRVRRVWFRLQVYELVLSRSPAAQTTSSQTASIDRSGDEDQHLIGPNLKYIPEGSI